MPAPSLIAKLITTLVMASRPAKKAMARFTGKMQTVFGKDGGKVVSALAMMALGNYTSGKLTTSMGGATSGAGSGAIWIQPKEIGTPDMNIPNGAGIGQGFASNFNPDILRTSMDIFGAAQGGGAKESKDGTLSSWLGLGLDLFGAYKRMGSSKSESQRQQEAQQRRQQALFGQASSSQNLSGQIVTPETVDAAGNVVTAKTQTLEEMAEEIQANIPLPRGPLPTGDPEEEREGIDWGDVWERTQAGGQQILDAAMEGTIGGVKQSAEDAVTGGPTPYIADVQRGSYVPTTITTPQQMQFQSAPYVQHAQAAALDPNVYTRYMTTVGSV